jgi:regulator of sirC expression with transglutaminase-like and TPR domain
MTRPYELGHPPGRVELLDALSMEPPRLDLAALAIARLGNEALDQSKALATLDALAARVRGRLHGNGLEALTSVLADDEGFTGDDATAFAPENSYLDQVLRRRRGLPITLSVLYIEVGRRAGLTVKGIGLPGHFVARLDDQYFDPFHQGRPLTEEACRQLVQRSGSSFDPRHLEPVTAQAICWRMLNNLKSTWLHRAEPEEALRPVDLLLALSPGHPSELRLRAGLLIDVGAFRAALADVEACLRLTTNPPDRESLTATAATLKKRIGLLH